MCGQLKYKEYNMVISHEDEILFQNLENARIGYYQNGNSSLSDEEYD
jgi:NAD-dependent DNA ligase